MTVDVWDPLRWAYIAAAVPLALAFGAAVVLAGGDWVQRVGTAALGMFCLVTVGGQAQNLGRSYTWITESLGVALALSLLAVVGYLARRWPDVRAGGRREDR